MQYTEFRILPEGVLPTAHHSLLTRKQSDSSKELRSTKPKSRSKPIKRKSLIPDADYGISWPGRLQRHHQIWEELQFHLELDRHRNAISVLLRVLLELAIENYIKQANVVVFEGDKLAKRLEKVGKDLHAKGLVEKKYLGILSKFQHSEQLVSADTLNRYIHSPSFGPSPEHLISIWDSLSEIIVLCLDAQD